MYLLFGNIQKYLEIFRNIQNYLSWALFVLFVEKRKAIIKNKFDDLIAPFYFFVYRTSVNVFLALTRAFAKSTISSTVPKLPLPNV